jgi:hypothetical protein
MVHRLTYKSYIYICNAMKIQKEIALKLMLGILVLLIVFHTLILTQIIPYTIVWAGKLKTVNEMFVFEIISISINLFLILLLLLKGGFIKNSFSEKLLNSILWVFIILFALNTIGNLTAETQFEKIVFTPLTFISAILLWVVVKKNEADKK